MPAKTVLITLLCAASCLASAQTANVTFPDSGDRQVWLNLGLPSQAPGDSDGVRTTKTEASLPINSQPDTATVFVWDHKTGNLASKTLKDVKSATWDVKDADYQDIAQVTVRVEHGGKSVAAATVDLDDGRRKASQLLDPSSHGAVTFFEVKPGSLKITVHYKVGGKDSKPLTQLVDVALTRTDPIPTATISLADNVDTVASDAASTTAAVAGPGQATSAGPQAGTGAPASDKPSGSIGGTIGSIVIYLLIIGGAVAAVVYALKYTKANQDSVASKLEQFGVQIPKAGDDPLANPSHLAPVAKPTPAPIQKIILDGAAPDLVTPVAVSSGVFDPRLVSQSGDAMPLNEGDLVVGREIGLGLSLVGESTVSRKHAQLTRSGNQVVVKDFGSTNGTFVNGVQVQGEKQLQSGDSVQFGSVKFRYEG